MSLVDVISIQDFERLTRVHNWANVIASGTAVTSVAVTAIDLTDSADATSTVMVSDSTTLNKTTFTFKAPASSDGKNYKITLKMTRDDSDLFEEDYMLKVRNF